MLRHIHQRLGRDAFVNNMNIPANNKTWSRVLTQQQLATIRGLSCKPSTSAVIRSCKWTSGLMHCGRKSETRPSVQATVSFTLTTGSFIIWIRRGRAWSTSGINNSGLGPSKIDPKAITAASRKRQSSLEILDSTNGTMGLTMLSPTHWAKRFKQVAAAIDTFHSSSSSSSSCLVRRKSRTGRIWGKAARAKLWLTRWGCSFSSAALWMKWGWVGPCVNNTHDILQTYLFGVKL